jgi:filamentous hemagglutinin family protein
MHPRLPRLCNLVLTVAALLALGVARAAAGPDGANVVGGAATIQGQGGPSVTINQSTPSAIINWRTFNIGTGENVRFNQPSSSSVALNRVTGGLGPSEILGTLTANGRVFIINRDGVLFGPGAVVNTAGFLATTSDIKNSDFMAGRYNFNIPGRPDASIVNQGRITATSGGFAALVAPGVRNTGTITATLGTVALASGNSFTLDMYGDKLITLAVGDSIASKVIDVSTGKPLKSLVSNEGKIRANGGRVELTAAAARTVVDSVINTSGVIKANSIGQRNGMIVLAAATGASKPAGAPTQTIKISGTLQAAGKRPGTKGGTVVVSGEDIKLTATRIDASGRAGGGKVMIGGDWGGGKPNTSLVKNQSAALEPYVIPTATTVSVDGATTINASAKERGNGGKVVLWSDSQTTFAGTILARGGLQGGDGGFVETSSHGQLAFTGDVDTRAPRGTAGTLLLDPLDFRIVPFCEGECGPNAMTAQQVQDQLTNGNFIIQTNNSQNAEGQFGDIFVQASISWRSNNSLTLSAYRDINIGPLVTIANFASGNLVLRADSTGTGIGTVNFITGTTLSNVNFQNSRGTVSIYYNPSVPAQGPDSKYQNPTNFLCSTILCGGVFVSQPSQLTSYMLVNSASDLQLVGTNLGGTYALGRSISASGFTGYGPGATFTGLFDGNGGLGVNYTISDLSLVSVSPVALFPFIESGATVRNLNLANVNISASLSITLVGALAGENRGTISNVHVLSGSVSGGSQFGIAAGGLVGQNRGLIASSSSAANVSVGDSDSNTASNIAGGLVATNLGTITDSSASGNVSGGAFSLVGGLVGQNGAFNLGVGSITSSFASGSVTVGNSSVAGAFVGTSNGTIVASSAIGSVTGGGNSVLGGFIGTLSFQNGPGVITNSIAQGPVTSTGPNSVVGGFVGLTSGSISSSTASGPVSGTSSSYLGGFVGTNLGLIELSTASGNVTGSGSNNIVGGFVGANFGSIDSSSASGNATSSADSAVGAFAGSNAQFVNFQPGSIPGSSFPVGTITNSSASGTASGGAGSTVSSFIALNNPTSASNPPAFPSIIAGCTDPTCVFVNTGQLPSASPFPPVPPTPTPTREPQPLTPQTQTQPSPQTLFSPGLAEQLAAQQTQQILNLTSTLQLAALNTAPVVNTTQGGIRLPPQQAPGSAPGTGTGTGPAAGNQFLPPGFDRRIIDIPPPGVTQLKTDEVMVQIRTDLGLDRLRAAVANLGVSILASEDLSILGSTAVRLHIDNGRTPAEVIESLAAVQLIAVAQPQYVYNLDQEAPAPAPAARSEGPPGDAAQYVVQKLSLADVHRMVRGTNVPIAVIDSEIDATHPDLEGAVAQRYDAVGVPDKPHPHGTGMAGAIGAHQRLLGTAPAARLLAVHAFSTSAPTAESTTFNILKGINWAVNQGARVINMSFAGPKDPSLERALKVAYDRNIVLIAAAGNAGPKSPPLYPGADPTVIAVTATDVDDKLFAGANRGKYVSVSAPGVDILVPAPESTYQLTTGTSVAAAEVSGIVALLIERNPKLTPADIRRILTLSARRLAPGERDDNFGAGLIDPLKALQLADPRSATTAPATPTRQR